MFTQRPVWHNSSSSQGTAVPDVGGDKSSAAGTAQPHFPPQPVGDRGPGINHCSAPAAPGYWHIISPGSCHGPLAIAGFTVRGCLCCLVCDFSGGHTRLSAAEAAFLCHCWEPRAVFRLCQAGLSHCHAANWDFPGIWHQFLSHLFKISPKQAKTL